MRYLGEVATAVSEINQTDRTELYEQLLKVAKRKTSDADVQLDESGKPVDELEHTFGSDVLIVSNGVAPVPLTEE